MKCTKCGKKSKVERTNQADDYIRRRYKCTVCENMDTTYEYIGKLKKKAAKIGCQFEQLRRFKSFIKSFMEDKDE